MRGYATCAILKTCWIRSKLAGANGGVELFKRASRTGSRGVLERFRIWVGGRFRRWV